MLILEKIITEWNADKTTSLNTVLKYIQTHQSEKGILGKNKHLIRRYFIEFIMQSAAMSS
jgi:hypothetical protein